MNVSLKLYEKYQSYRILKLHKIWRNSDVTCTLELYANELVNDVIASQFPIYSVYMEFQNWHLLERPIWICTSYHTICFSNNSFAYIQWVKLYILSAEEWCWFYFQNEWRFVRQWHQWLAHLDIAFLILYQCFMKFATKQEKICSIHLINKT